jgi:hypothetical protein
MNDTVSCPTPEPDTRTVNEVVAKRIAQLRERADEMESKLASMPAELLDMRVSDLGVLDIYV